MNQTLVEDEDVNAKWTFNSGGHSSQFASDWGGVLVAGGEDEDDDEWGGVCVSEELKDEEDFNLVPVFTGAEEEEKKEPELSLEPPVEEMQKVQLDFPGKLRDISEEKALGESHDTLQTARESISSQDSAPASPKATIKEVRVMSPMERARLALSKKSVTKSARSKQKASARLALNSLALTSMSDMPYM